MENIHRITMENLVDAKTCTEDIKNMAEALAWLSARLFFVYFVYKVLSGDLRPNTSMKVEYVRRPGLESNVEDYLQITVTDTKGDRGTIIIHKAQARIRMATAKECFVLSHGILRRSYTRETLALQNQSTKAPDGMKPDRAHHGIIW